MEIFYAPLPQEELKKQKALAREFRQSQWWKNQLGQGVCYHCQLKFHPSELTMDHLIPIARGGKSSRGNCVPSCKTCNTKKGNLTKAELVMQDENLNR